MYFSVLIRYRLWRFINLFEKEATLTVVKGRGLKNDLGGAAINTALTLRTVTATQSFSIGCV